MAFLLHYEPDTSSLHIDLPATNAGKIDIINTNGASVNTYHMIRICSLLLGEYPKSFAFDQPLIFHCVVET